MDIPAPYNINTKKISLINKKLREVPSWIQHLTKLEYISLDMNRISVIPDWLGNMTHLKSISFSKNTISDLPISLSNLINLRDIRLQYNHFRHIPECISNMINLEYFSMSYNMIDNIPEAIFYNCINIISFSISNNYLTSIPSNIDKLINMTDLIISHNDIITLPIAIIRLKLLHFYYKENPYEYLSPPILRYLFRINNNIDHLHVYSDPESVHTPSIQKSLTRSIENIMNQPFNINMDKIMMEIKNDPINCKYLEEYSQSEDVHSILQITFKELLCYVWETIKTLDNQDEIKKILNTEMIESQNKCFTGKLSRLINCLNGFTELVSINIDTSEEIGNIITIEQHKLGDMYTIELHKENVKIALVERGYTDDIILDWLQFIE